MKRKSVIVIASIIAVIAIAFFGIRNQMKKKASNDDNTIKIGAILFLTGPQAASGKDVLEGLKLAEQALSTSTILKGKKIKLLIEDSKDSPKTAIAAFQKLVSQNCSAIISSGDVIAFNLAPFAEKNNIPLLTVVAEANDIPKLNSWVHRVWIPDYLLISSISKYISRELHAKKIAILAINNEFGLSSVKEFSRQISLQNKSKIVCVEYYGISDKDMKSQVAKALVSNPDTFFVIGFGEGFGTAVNQLKELGFSGNICCSVTMAIDYYQKQTAKSNEGVFFPAPAFSTESPNENLTHFTTSFQKAMNHAPSFTSAFAYESLNFVAAAIATHGDTSYAIQQGLTKLPPQKTVFGDIYYDKNRDVVMRTSIFKMHNGKPKLVKIYNQ